LPFCHALEWDDRILSTEGISGNARKQLRKLDKAIARRILDFIDERVAACDDPRLAGKALRAC
jgi:mRNA-degrading endonuclease RelE of RelBE toxin-antitoxin system